MFSRQAVWLTLALIPLGALSVSGAERSDENDLRCPVDQRVNKMKVDKAPVKGLPYAGDRAFCTLDEYLAYRQSLGATDRPYYKLVTPHVYELIKPRLRDERVEYYSREQLAKAFGFPVEE